MDKRHVSPSILITSTFPRLLYQLEEIQASRRLPPNGETLHRRLPRRLQDSKQPHRNRPINLLVPPDPQIRLLRLHRQLPEALARAPAQPELLHRQTQRLRHPGGLRLRRRPPHIPSNHHGHIRRERSPAVRRPGGCQLVAGAYGNGKAVLLPCPRSDRPFQRR